MHEPFLSLQWSKVLLYLVSGANTSKLLLKVHKMPLLSRDFLYKRNQLTLGPSINEFQACRKDE